MTVFFNKRVRSQGKDVIIAKNAVFTRPSLVALGNHVSIDHGFYCTTQLNILDYVHISPYVTSIGGADASLIVSNFCFISVGARMVCQSEKFLGAGLIGPLIPKEFQDDRNKWSHIFLQPFSGVCAGSTVLPGCILSEGSVLGANSLLLENTVTDPWTIYVGSPAKPIKVRRRDKMIELAKELGYV